MTATDPSGLLTVAVVSGPVFHSKNRNVFGAFAWAADFKLSAPAPCDGVIVQHVRMYTKERTNFGPWLVHDDYWEFWDVKAGKVFPDAKYDLPGAFVAIVTAPPNPVFNLAALQASGKHNDWYYFSSNPKMRGEKYDGLVWFAQGSPPTLEVYKRVGREPEASIPPNLCSLVGHSWLASCQSKHCPLGASVESDLIMLDVLPCLAWHSAVSVEMRARHKVVFRKDDGFFRVCSGSKVVSVRLLRGAFRPSLEN